MRGNSARVGQESIWAMSFENRFLPPQCHGEEPNFSPPDTLYPTNLRTNVCWMRPAHGSAHGSAHGTALGYYRVPIVVISHSMLSHSPHPLFPTLKATASFTSLFALYYTIYSSPSHQSTPIGTCQSFGHLHHWTGRTSLTEMLPEVGLDYRPLLNWRPDALLTGLRPTGGR